MARLPHSRFIACPQDNSSPPLPFLQHLLYVTVTDAVWLLTRLVDDLYILLTLHRGHQSSEDDKMKVQQHNKHIFLTVTSCCSLSAEVFELFQYSFSSTSFDSQQQSKTIQLQAEQTLVHFSHLYMILQANNCFVSHVISSSPT